MNFDSIQYNIGSLEPSRHFQAGTSPIGSSDLGSQEEALKENIRVYIEDSSLRALTWNKFDFVF